MYKERTKVLNTDLERLCIQASTMTNGPTRQAIERRKADIQNELDRIKLKEAALGEG